MLRRDLSEDRYLRLFEESDADELFAVIDTNRGFLARWLPWVDSARDPAYALEWIRRTRRQLGENSGLQLAIIEDGAIVGVAGVWAIDANRAATLGYWIAEDRQGRGIVSDALTALIEHAFVSLGVNRLELRTAVDNERSKAVAKRLGFTREGTLRQAERHGDHYVDVDVFSLLASDAHGE